MISAEFIKEKAKEYGAAVCGIGSLLLFEGEAPGKDPRQILPRATCILGFGFPVPKGYYQSLVHGGQYYGYTAEGVMFLDEEFAEIFLFRIGKLLEDEGFDACLQRTVPNLRAKGDKSTNPEVADTYELIADPVAPGKPAPDVMLDFGKAAQACGIGMAGKSGRILNSTYGPFLRYCFLITDAPLETDSEYNVNHCTGCNACLTACPGHAISEQGLNTWQCAVYYKGAHKSNPFMTDAFLQGDPERETILNGRKRFTAESARKVIAQMHFLPNTQYGYAPCLCGKKCDLACAKHILGVEFK